MDGSEERDILLPFFWWYGGARAGWLFFYEERKNEYQLHSTWMNNMTFTTASFFLVPVILMWQVVFLHGGQLEVVNLAVSFPPFGVARADMAVHVTLLWRPGLGTDEPGLGSGEEKGGGIYIPTYDGDTGWGWGDSVVPGWCFGEETEDEKGH